jgi:hypothetical protein
VLACFGETRVELGIPQIRSRLGLTFDVASESLSAACIHRYMVSNDMSSQPTTFRFRDLPREIRDKIYRELLCNFRRRRPAEGFMSPEETFEYTQANKGNEAAILRTNKDVYREAYDVMVKTNRFVRLTSARGLPIILLLQSIRVLSSHRTRPRLNNLKAMFLRFASAAQHLRTRAKAILKYPSHAL